MTKSEVFKDIGKVTNRELEHAGIDSVRELFESTPADVSNATKEPVATAINYINAAEVKALQITTVVNNELKRVKVMSKKDLDRLDIRALAGVIGLPQTKVRKILNAVRKTE